MTGYSSTRNRKIASRAIISVLALWLVFCGMAAAEQLYVNESGWWREDGAFNASGTPIQAAVDNATAGDSVFVWNGTYYEGGGVSITKDGITLQGEDANTTTIHGKWIAEKVVDVSGNYVNASGFTVTGSTSSGFEIRVMGSNCLVSNNIANSNSHGIYVYDSSNCIITNNTVNLNSHAPRHGIDVYDSSNCTITNNIVNSGTYCIYVYHSSNCTIINNIANSGNYGYGIYVYHSGSCIITNNIANSNNCGYGIYVYDSSNCTITNNIASLNSHGIRLYSSNNCTITNNIANSNYYGIYVYGSSTDNIIAENNISNNTGYGINLDYTADNEIYHNNFIDNNKQAYDHNGFNEWDKGLIIGGNYWSDHICHGNPSNGTKPYTEIDTNAGAVDNYPFEEPNGWTTAPPLFTTTDAVIALRIAAGSRPFDSRYDVSGDGSVTSLDALTILQAAAGAIGL